MLLFAQMAFVYEKMKRKGSSPPGNPMERSLVV
jgi:hypothetical protein